MPTPLPSASVHVTDTGTGMGSLSRMQSNLLVSRTGSRWPLVGIQWTLLVILAISPLPLGSNRPVFWAINGVFAALLTIVLVPAARRSHLDWRPVAWAVAGITLVLAWMLIQTAALPLPVISDPLGAAGNVATTGTISLDHAATLTALVRFMTPALLGLVAFVVYLDRAGRGRSHRILDLVVALTTLIAGYGLYALYSGLGQPSLVASPDYDGFLTGTFVNRNTAATYLSIGLACCVARFFEVVGGGRDMRTSNRREQSFGGIYIVAAAVLVSAILSTGSRAGMVAGFAGLIAVLAIGYRARSGTGYRILSVAVVGVVIAMVLLSVSSVLGRIGAEQLTSDERFAVYSDTLRMIADRPLLGHGAGTFPTVFPLYHGAAVPSERVWLAAHNTYLQAAAELGLPAVGIILLVLGAALVRVISGALSPRPASVTVAALGAFVVVGVHSLLDFSLQIESVAILFAILVGAGTALALRNRTALPAEEVTTGRTGAMPPSRGRSRPDVHLHYAVVAEAVKPPAVRAPSTRRIYAFGDVHGRLDLLKQTAEAIARDLADNPGEAPLIIGRGDYIDRGPDSRGVLDLMVAGLVPDAEHIYIRGNHEQLLLDVLDGDLTAYEIWLKSGGVECLRSYGVDVAEEGQGAAGFDAVRRSIAHLLPRAHYDLLRSMPTSHLAGDYLFVHGGVNPRKPLAQQSSEEFLWHRYKDERRDDPFERVVVHGHSPISEPFLGRYRINLDTGAYASNRLSCIVLEGRRRRLLTPDAGPEAAQLG